MLTKLLRIQILRNPKPVFDLFIMFFSTVSLYSPLLIPYKGGAIALAHPSQSQDPLSISDKQCI